MIAWNTFLSSAHTLAGWMAEKKQNTTVLRCNSFTYIYIVATSKEYSLLQVFVNTLFYWADVE